MRPLGTTAGHPDFAISISLSFFPFSEINKRLFFKKERNPLLHIFCLVLLAVSGSALNPVPATPSQLEAEVLGVNFPWGIFFFSLFKSGSFLRVYFPLSWFLLLSFPGLYPLLQGTISLHLFLKTEFS